MKVTFRYFNTFDQKVERVNLVGSFNNWDTHNVCMEYDSKKHCWEYALDLKAGDYPYKFLINLTDWVHDNNAGMFVQNDVGSLDSIVRVRPEHPEHGKFSPLAPKLTDKITITSAKNGSLVWSVNGWNPYPKGVLRKSIPNLPNISHMNHKSSEIYEYTIDPFQQNVLPEVIAYNYVFQNGEVDDNYGRNYWIPIDLSLRGKTFDLSFESEALQGKPNFRVYLPKGYHYSDKKFPVMFLIHGYGGNYKSDWSQGDIIKKMADIFGIILVWPDGNVWVRGENIPSWYLNSPQFKEAKMEDFIIKELIPYMEAKFRVIKGKEGRAIGGISMGGYGAIYLGTRYHQHFRVACSMSAIYNLIRYKNLDALRKLVGSKWQGRTYDCIKLAKNAKDTSYWFIVGDEERSAHKDNLRLKEAMEEAGLDFSFNIHPGNHTNNFWRMHTQEMMSFAAKRLCPDYEKRMSDFLESIKKPDLKSDIDLPVLAGIKSVRG